MKTVYTFILCICICIVAFSQKSSGLETINALLSENPSYDGKLCEYNDSKVYLNDSIISVVTKNAKCGYTDSISMNKKSIALIDTDFYRDQYTIYFNCLNDDECASWYHKDKSDNFSLLRNEPALTLDLPNDTLLVKKVLAEFNTLIQRSN